MTLFFSLFCKEPEIFSAAFPSEIKILRKSKFFETDSFQFEVLKFVQSEPRDDKARDLRKIFKKN